MNTELIALETKRIAGYLPAPQRFTIDVLGQIDSTSTELRRRAERGGIDGHVIAAETQTGGRGRHGREWIDSPGGSLLVSLGWRPPQRNDALAGLSLAVGVAVCRALDQEQVSGVRLKWPNDLLHHHCKLGGILVETVTGPDGLSVVIGIGINVRLPEAVRSGIAAPVTDLEAAGWSGDRNALLAAILVQIDTALTLFAASGFRAFRADWLARHALQMRNVTIWREGRESAAGRAVDVDADGALLLQTPAGVRRLLSGELTLRPG